MLRWDGLKVDSLSPYEVRYHGAYVFDWLCLLKDKFIVTSHGNIAATKEITHAHKVTLISWHKLLWKAVIETPF